MGAKLSRQDQPLELDPKRIELMTRCFDQEIRRIPSGSGDGDEESRIIVYKGDFEQDGGPSVEVLVECGKNEFKNRVTAMWSPHPNIARLIGFCKSPFMHALVMPLEKRGCLKDMVLAGNLTWKQRVKIIKGMALALEHLHDAKNILGFQVLHLDVRMENVWVAQDYTPKLAGFHSCKIKRSKCFVSGSGSSSISTTSRSDSEQDWSQGDGNYGELTSKVDVYSFGMVVLEIISGRELQNSLQILLTDPKLAVEQWIDRRMQNVPESEAMGMIQVSRVCLERNPAARPRMDELVF